MDILIREYEDLLINVNQVIEKWSILPYKIPKKDKVVQNKLLNFNSFEKNDLKM